MHRLAMLVVVLLATAVGGVAQERPAFGERPAPFSVDREQAAGSQSDAAEADGADSEDAAEHLADFGGLPGAGVTGRIYLEDVDLEAGTAVLRARFVPPDGFYLYSKDLSMRGVDGMGRPTLIEIADGQPISALGPPETESVASDKQVLDWVFPLYDAGPVTLRLPIALPAGDGDPVSVTVWLSYMTCDDDTCLRPVEREEVQLALPSTPSGQAPPDQPSDDTGAAADDETPSQDAPTADNGIAQRLAEATPRTNLSLGQWYYPSSVDELLAIMAGAQVNGQRAFLEFTGPSCVNCQIMKRTVFEEEVTQAAFADMVLVSINTDPPYTALGDFQREAYGTFTRPFYVHLQPDAPDQAWWTYFRPTNQAEMDRFIAFLQADAQVNAAAADASATFDAVSDAVRSGITIGFLLLAVAGGLFTLVMPCTYPMIPLTINFFTKQGERGISTTPLALTYALGIIGFFMIIGLVFAGVIGANPQVLAGHWLTNLIIALLFLVLGASLLGVFFLRLPSGMMNLGQGSQGGYAGALIMGLAFAIISFTCTAPFAGLVLGAAMITGEWSAAVIGMAVYGAVIAIPFFFLSLSPRLLKTLPGAGAWMNEFKVVGGLIEIAAAFKFLYIADLALSWGIFDRTVVLAIWTVICLLIAVYIAGKIRMASDAVVEQVGPWRLLLMVIFASMGFFFLAGLTGTHLGAVEGLFP